jgi:hypothetical protein
MLHTIKQRKGSNVLCMNCLVKHDTEVKMEGYVRRRRSKQLLVDLEDTQETRNLKRKR